MSIEKHSTGPLDGIRVLDFSRVLAGPLCSMMLGDLGADVIKVERPHIGDETRAWGPPWADVNQNYSAYFLCINRNKRSITLNLRSEAGQKIARDLSKSAHIVIENFKPGQMSRFNLGYDDLSAINPALVYCSITGFGQSGPYQNRPGYDFVIQAMSGLMSITGPKDGPPHKVGVAVSDVFTALFACNAIQGALRHAERTGIGQHIDMALFDSQLAALVNIGSNFLVSGDVPARFGNDHANIVPYQTFQAKDQAFVVAVGNDRQFARLCTLLNREDLTEDEHYHTNPARVANRVALTAILSEAFAKHEASHWVQALLEVGIPSGPINSVAQALNDPHTIERGMVETITLPDATEVQQTASPLNLSQTPPTTRYPPPQLGEHTEQILQDLLGMSQSQINQLRDEEAI